MPETAPGRPLTVVTGGTRGIGAATALRLADAGHDLVLTFLADAEAASDTREACLARGVGCDVVRGDLSRADDVEALVASLPRRPDHVVNNAGLTGPVGPLAEADPAVVRRVVDVNLTGAILVARAAVRAMSTAYGGSGGVLVNVSSGAATIGSPGDYVHYAAAKAGVDALTLGLAQEAGPQGVRVVGVAPGAIRTRIHADAGDPGRLDRIGDAVALRRAGEPEEVADAILWLTSDAASYVTGTTLRVAGGR
ncbi:SDR family NAD(P)-dependent oxidoreductase [Nocardioides sp. CFH 31398]|uniref:SDR family NAD(P)-dependent oxidoreductase n=1 Tax=Nocardioides sp. CFH 31398 TaxID=2919579 RepID=UPI001F062BA7|nr:SDR family oxidoreductase [Nocardioides sp. CFH 31398]MCH1866496.1 SDR family oxidoreductase [Nocardioides sp. CFH 31398]